MSVVSDHIDAPQGAQAIIRAIRLLKAVAAHEEGSSLTELASELDLSPSTTHRILAALESEGLLAQDSSSRHYTLGLAALTISAHALHKSDLRALARPMLQRLAEASGETATLEIPVEGEMLILDEVAGSQIIGARIEVGTRWPVYATSTGKALLATLPKDEFEKRLAYSRTQFTSSTLVDPGMLRSDIERTRENGFATVANELEAGYAAVGAAVLDRNGRGIAALSIGGPSERLDHTMRRLYADLVLKSAKELSNLLSAQSGS